MLEIETVLQKLLMYYDLDNMSQLADKIGVSQPTISKWKARNSIIPVKKICRELGIYNEIFDDLNIGTIINQGNNGRASGRDYNEATNQKEEINFDTVTIGLVKKAIEKFGSEEEFQFQLMNFLRDK